MNGALDELLVKHGFAAAPAAAPSLDFSDGEKRIDRLEQEFERYLEQPDHGELDHQGEEDAE